MQRLSVGLRPQLPTLLESTPKPLLIPARTVYPYDIALKVYKETRPPFKVLTSVFNARGNWERMDKFKYNNLLQGMAFHPDDPINLAAWKEYMLQDYYYLIELYKFREKRLNSIYQRDSGSYAIEVAGLAKLKSYIDNDFVQMLKKLGIADRIGKIQPHTATTNYINWLMKLADYESYYGLNMAQAPCSYGWSVSAQEIFHHPNFKKEGDFYEQFVLPNVTDYLEYEKTELGEDGIPFTTIVRVPQIGSWSGTARRVGEFTDWRVQPPDYDLNKAAMVAGEGIEHETAMMNGAVELVKKRAKEEL